LISIVASWSKKIRLFGVIILFKRQRICIYEVGAPGVSAFLTLAFCLAASASIFLALPAASRLVALAPGDHFS
jgi:hypothetical protein